MLFRLPAYSLAGMNLRTVSRWGRGFHFRIAVLKIFANSFSSFSMQQMEKNRYGPMPSLHLEGTFSSKERAGRVPGTEFFNAPEHTISERRGSGLHMSCSRQPPRSGTKTCLKPFSHHHSEDEEPLNILREKERKDGGFTRGGRYARGIGSSIRWRGSSFFIKC